MKGRFSLKKNKKGFFDDQKSPKIGKILIQIQSFRNIVT